VPKLDVFGLSDTGKRRSNNEDQFLVAALEQSMTPLYTALTEGAERREVGAHVFIVADGVGGGAAGELASSKTVQVLAEEIARSSGCFYDAGPDTEHEFIGKLEQAMHLAHERVKTELAMDGGKPASTATMVALYWPRGYVFHVGDSRGYYLRRNTLKQFTRDQTVGEFMVDAGLLSEEQAKKGGLHDVLTHAIGGDDSTPSIGLVDFEPGDTLMMCSDGLTKHVTDEAIERTLAAAESAGQAAQELLAAALEGGGTDNITIIVARMGDADQGVD
jgi:protein phosphatase